METAYLYAGVSGLLTALMWTPYILARIFVWGPWNFITNYPKGFPAHEPEPPLWAQRAKRAHLNMVETMPAFLAVLIAADYIASGVSGVVIGLWAQTFFFARVAHALVYTLGIPFLRTPTYLVSWAAILMIGVQIFR